jgi:hypothetical protein
VRPDVHGRDEGGVQLHAYLPDDWISNVLVGIEQRSLSGYEAVVC